MRMNTIVVTIPTTITACRWRDMTPPTIPRRSADAKLPAPAGLLRIRSHCGRAGTVAVDLFIGRHVPVRQMRPPCVGAQRCGVNALLASDNVTRLEQPDRGRVGDQCLEGARERKPRSRP